jgi:hypothetical protein
MNASLPRTRLRYTRLFLAWSLLSTAAGGLLWAFCRPAVPNAVGMEFTIWGVLNLFFAIQGIRQTRESARRNDPAWDRDDAEKLLRALSFSSKLNYLWLAMGLALAVWGALATSPVLWGHAIGVFTQGAFLFLFDRYLHHAVSRELAC